MAEGPEPAPANEDTTPPLSLKQRLAAIRAESFGIGKDNINMSYFDKKTGAKKDFTIRGHTVEAVLSEMRPLLTEAEVDLWPYLIERTYAGNRCDVIIDWTFERLDESDEKRVVRWAGAGTDDGDKGFSKAGTNCLKEMLKKVFLITDRDDAKEETESVEHKAEGATRADIERARDAKEAAILQWAKTFKVALESVGTLADLQRLQRENRDQLADESMPDVTRDFFIELIEKRKKALDK